MTAQAPPHLPLYFTYLQAQIANVEEDKLDYLGWQ